MSDTITIHHFDYTAPFRAWRSQPVKRVRCAQCERLQEMTTTEVDGAMKHPELWPSCCGYTMVFYPEGETT